VPGAEKRAILRPGAGCDGVTQTRAGKSRSAGLAEGKNTLCTQQLLRKTKPKNRGLSLWKGKGGYGVARCAITERAIKNGPRADDQYSAWGGKSLSARQGNRVFSTKTYKRRGINDSKTGERKKNKKMEVGSYQKRVPNVGSAIFGSSKIKYAAMTRAVSKKRVVQGGNSLGSSF